jgi:hypothetical protein
MKTPEPSRLRIKDAAMAADFSDAGFLQSLAALSTMPI